MLPYFLGNRHFTSHFVWKSTKTLELLRIFDEFFDVINGEPFLTLYKTSAIVYILQGKIGKTEKNRKGNQATKVTKNQKTKIWDVRNIQVTKFKKYIT